MRFERRLFVDLQHAIWRVCSRFLPRREPEPSEHYAPPEGGWGGGESLVVKASLIEGAGLGLFTTQHHSSGEVLCLYTGEPVSILEQARSPHTNYFARTSSGVICARKYLNVKARYVNHHFDPSKRNTALEETNSPHHRRIVATRNIQPDEELYCDYGDLYWYWHGLPPSVSTKIAGNRR